MSKKKMFLLVTVIVILFMAFLFVLEYRFSYKSAVQARTKERNIDILELLNINKDTDLILYENVDNETYGLVKFYNFLNILYRPDFSAQGYAVPNGSPFLVVNHYEVKENKYIIFIKTNDSRIKYVSIGTEKHDFTKEEYESYIVSFDEVKNKPDIYQIKQLENGSACFVGELEEPEKWIYKNVIMGFDENGNLIADRNGLMYGRYIKR